MSWMQCLLEYRDNLSQLWKKYEIFAESDRLRAEQLRRHLNPWLCHQEEQQSRCQTRTFWTTNNVLPGETNAEKGPSAKARKPPNNTFTMVRRRIVKKFIVWHRVGRKTFNALWQNRLGEELPHRNKSWENFKIRSVGLSRQMQKEELSNHSINDPSFAQAKREYKRLHDEHLARTQQEYRHIPRSQQVRQRKEQQFEGSEEFDCVVDPKTRWRF